MVLPLSSRILRAEAKAKGIGFTLASTSRKRISGYSADRSDQESPPASLCTSSTLEKTKEKRAQHVEMCAKRRRKEEATFQAFNARNDLAQAGVKCQPGFLFGRSRALPQGCVDMDTVNLIVVSKEAPSKDDQESFQQTSHTADSGYCDVSSEDYVDLLTSAQHFYLAKGRIPTPSEDAVNERSSQISSSNTTDFSSPVDSENEFEMEIPPIAQNEKCDDETLPNSTDTMRYIKTSLDLAVLTLSEAIMHFSSARLIVEKKSHLRIVNSNAAFSRLTGISSEDLIGKSLIELLEESFVTENKTNITLVKIRNALCDGSNIFSLVTFPVENKKAFVTHFALEFSEPREMESQGTYSTKGATSVPSVSLSKPFNAVG